MLLTMQDMGYLLVSTRTADGVLLLPNTDVKVFDSTGNLLFEGKTNRDGYTEEIAVLTPPLANSLSPDGGTPYAEVGILVERDGFYTANFESVPIFPNVVTIQPTSLQAIPGSAPILPYFDSTVDESGASDVI